MAEFDLIPADYAQARLFRRRMKRFAVALLSAACVVALARLGLQSLISAENGKAVRLQHESQLSAQAEAAAQQYRQRKQAAERQLEALDRLGSQDRVRIMLDAIDAAYVEGVWLDALKFSRRETAPAAQPRSLAGQPARARAPAPNAAPARAAAPEVEHYAEIVGHAVNHSTLAEFLRRLSHQPGIAEVRLVGSGMRGEPQLTAINARISLLLDDTPRRRP